MKVKVYLDVIFLYGFFADYLILTVFRKFMKCTATHLRIFLGCLVGAGVSLGCVLLPMLLPNLLAIDMGDARILEKSMQFLVSTLGISYFYIRVVFQIKGKEVFYGWMILYAMAFLVEGVMNWLYAHSSYLRKSTWIEAFIFGGIFLYTCCICLFQKMKQSMCRNICQIRIQLQNRWITVKAIVDTGNSLVEPISGKEVSVIEKSCLDAAACEIPMERIRMIPFHSVGKNQGMMIGFLPEKMMVQGESGQEDILIKNSYIGIFDGKLSGRGEYQMLLHPQILP